MKSKACRLHGNGMGCIFVSLMVYAPRTHLYKNENFQIHWYSPLSMPISKMNLITSKNENNTKFICIHAAYSVAETRHDVSHISMGNWFIDVHIHFDSTGLTMNSIIQCIECGSLISPRLRGIRKRTKTNCATISTLKWLNEHDSHDDWHSFHFSLITESYCLN